MNGNPLRSHLSSQALHLVPVSVKIVRSSTQMAHVCAELVLFSTMNWISKALPQTVCMTASLRLVVVLINATCLQISFFYKFQSPYTKIYLPAKLTEWRRNTVRALTYGHVARLHWMCAGVNILQVYRRCDTGQIRLAASRECASPSLYSCNITCGPHGGTLDVEMGM